MSRDDSAHFVAKWLDAEPWQRLLLVFEAPGQRPCRRLVESLGFELRRTALDSSDASVTAAKLGWWGEEWTLLAQGAPRHPVTVALAGAATSAVDAEAGRAWIAAAAQLADDVSDADTASRVRHWLRFTDAQSNAARSWLPARPGDGNAHAVALLVERLADLRADLARGRLPLPLSVLAAHGVTRAGVAAGESAAHAALAAFAGELAESCRRSGHVGAGRYRRGQTALARLRARRLLSDPALGWAERAPLPALRSAFEVWLSCKGP